MPFTKIPNEINLKNAAEPTGLSDADLDCVNDPGMPGWSMASCQRDGNLAGLTFTRNDDGRLGAGIFLLNGPTWTRTHFVEEEAPGTWSQITVRVGSFGGSSSPTAFFGYRYAGTGGFLDVDIVRLRTNGELRFQGLRSLDKGAVAIPPGNDPGLVVTAQPGPADPNCCPSAFLVRGLRLNNGVWEISDGTTVPAADAPTGPFDL